MITVIHHNDIDGYASAWVAKKAMEKTNYLATYHSSTIAFHAVDYDDPIPFDVSSLTEDDFVYILDFSYSYEKLMSIREKIKCFVIDHHKTAEEDLKDYPKDSKLFRTGTSGCLLTWEHFFGDKEPPSILKYVNEHDLFRFDLPDSKEIRAYLRSFPLSIDLFDSQQFSDVAVDRCLKAFSYEDELPRYVRDGEAILRMQQRQVEQAVKSASEIIIYGHKVLAANSSNSDTISLIGHELAKDRPFGVVWFHAGFDEKGQNKYVCSLRSTEQGIDVGEIAKKFGGGGHALASGFTMSSPPTEVFIYGESPITQALPYVILNKKLEESK